MLHNAHEAVSLFFEGIVSFCDVIPTNLQRVFCLMASLWSRTIRYLLVPFTLRPKLMLNCRRLTLCWLDVNDQRIMSVLNFPVSREPIPDDII